MQIVFGTIVRRKEEKRIIFIAIDQTGLVKFEV